METRSGLGVLVTPEARHQEYSLMRPDGITPSSVACVCQTCGSTFYRWPSRVAAGSGKFCSMACRYPAKIVKACENCGATVERAPAFVTPYKHTYCSVACMGAAKVISPAEQIRRNVDTSAGPNACWPWTGSRDRAGYGRFSLATKDIRAHRAAWEVANRQKVPDGLVIRHLCPGGGNPWCCNPAHLTPGTAQQNSQDMVKAGRQWRGGTRKSAAL